MNKIQIFIIVLIFLIPISAIHAYAQTLYVDATVGDMKKIENSKYKGSGVSIVRNGDGELMSVVRVEASRYLDDPIVDEFLNSEPKFLIKKGTVNNEKVSLYKVEVDYYNPECLPELFKVPGYMNECDWYHRAFVTMLGLNDPDGEKHTAFRGLNHVYTIKTFYEVKTIWHIFVRG